MNKLISMVNFVLQQDITDIKQRDSIVKYANFLRQPLKLEMFINCDDDGNVLKEPKKTNYQVDVNTKCSGWKYLYDNNDKLIGYYDDRKWKEDFVKYKQSKEKVLFEDSVLIDETMYHQTKRVLIMLKSYPTFRIFNQFYYRDGSIERQLFPNNENLRIEDLIKFELELTESAIKQIGL